MRPAHVAADSRRRDLSVLAVLLAIHSLAPTVASATTFPLKISPTHGPAGATVELSARDLSPGGFTWSVYWDGALADTFTMPPGDSFTHPFVIPANATLTSHSIKVCISCGDVEFEWSGTNTYTVTSTGGTGGDFDAQVLTMELTQGLRSDLNLRAVPDGGPVIFDDGTVHVKNRRTVVRVYPWIDLDIGATAPALTAELRGFRDGVELPGSPLSPVNPRVTEIEESATLTEMRRDPSRTWNFVLPMDWVQHSTAPGEYDDPVQLTLNAKVNPDGPLYVPERPGASINNVAQLIDQEFVHVTGERNVPFRFFPVLINFTDVSDPDNAVFKPAPSMGQVIQRLHEAATAMPVPAGNNSRSNMMILPPRLESFEGTLSTDKGKRRFRRQMVRRYFPGGDFDRPARGDYYIFMFNGDFGCGGHAFLNSAYIVSTTCDWVFIHELTHALGQAHAGNGHGESDGGGYDPDYPGSHGQVESNAFGFNVYAMTAQPPVAFGTPSLVVHDYMSYGGGPDWVSLYRWNKVAEALDAPEIAPKMAPAEAGTWLMLAGRADAAGSELDFVFESVAPLASTSTSLTAYSLRFNDANGIVLLDHPLTDDRAQEFDGESGYDFLAVAAPPTGWAFVEILENDTVLEQRFRSANPPMVALFSPANYDVWPATGTVNASWFASDADSDVLNFRLEGSLDGVEWFALHDETGASFVDVDMTKIPAGDTSMFVRVQASDGLNVATSNLVLVTLQPRAPSAFVVQPAEGAQYMADQHIALFGLAGDWQDGDLAGGNLTWLVDGSWVANGNAHELPPLAPGVHTVELIAYNSYQLSGQMSVTITVVGSLLSPALVEPSLGSTGQPTDVTFEWDAVAGANGYRLQVSDDPQFAQLLLDYGAVHGTSYWLGGLDADTTYYWRARPQSVTDLGPWSNQSWFTTGVATGVGPTPHADRWGFRLEQPAPNPFNPRTVVEFTLDHGARVDLAVYDLRGRRVATLAEETKIAGTHRVEWNGRDEAGESVASGTYFVRLDVLGHGTEIRKVALLK